MVSLGLFYVNLGTSAKLKLYALRDEFPRTCPSCFIVPLDRYMESEMKDYSIGKKFKMRFEDDAGGEQWFGGTITGVEDIDHIRWPGSKWRCIKVIVCPNFDSNRWEA